MVLPLVAWCDRVRVSKTSRIIARAEPIIRCFPPVLFQVRVRLGSAGAGRRRITRQSDDFYPVAYPVMAIVLGTFFAGGRGQTEAKRFAAIFFPTAIAFVFGVPWLPRVPSLGRLRTAIATGLTPRRRWTSAVRSR